MGARFTGHSTDLSTAEAIERAVAVRWQRVPLPPRPPDGHIEAGGVTYRRYGHIVAFDGRGYEIRDYDGKKAVYMAAHLFGRVTVATSTAV